MKLAHQIKSVAVPGQGVPACDFTGFNNGQPVDDEVIFVAAR